MSRSRYRSSGYGSSVVTTILMFLVVVVIFVLAAGGCGALTPKSKAINAAEDAGYTNVRVIGKAIFFVELRGCGKDDEARFTVRATNPRGEEKTFYVCAGVLKGGTIRSR